MGKTRAEYEYLGRWKTTHFYEVMLKKNKLSDSQKEIFEEKASIYQFEGKMNRYKAEVLAYRDVILKTT